MATSAELHKLYSYHAFGNLTDHINTPEANSQLVYWYWKVLDHPCRQYVTVSKLFALYYYENGKVPAVSRRVTTEKRIVALRKVHAVLEEIEERVM